MRTAVLVTVGVAMALAVPSLAACGGDSGPEPAPAEESAEKPSKPTPISCLGEAGLSNVEKRDKGLWRGFPPTAASCSSTSSAEAREAVKDADLVVSEAVGRYFVHGPVPDADDGSSAAVADCLRGMKDGGS